jgi:hypothetical protein
MRQWSVRAVPLSKAHFGWRVLVIDERGAFWSSEDMRQEAAMVLAHEIAGLVEERAGGSTSRLPTVR